MLDAASRNQQGSSLFGRYRSGYYLLLLIALLEILGASAIGVSVGNVDPARLVTLGGLAAMLPAWVILPLLWLGTVAVTIARRQIDRPAAALWRLVRRHRHWLLRGVLFTALFFPLGRAFSAYKTAIPHLVPYYADPYFVIADRAIFGDDPWRFTHALFGPAGTLVLDRVYALWFPMMMLLLGWLNFTRNQRLQLQGLLTYLLCWAFLGNLVATAFSSVGPCFYAEFYHDQHFAELMATLHAGDASHPIFATRAMRYLLDSVGHDRLGAGISAMPSLHVSIALLFFLVALAGSRQRWLKVAAGAFALAILVGSVHLGWHYAVDGLVSIVGTIAIWSITGRYVAWLEGRVAPPSRARLAPAVP